MPIPAQGENLKLGKGSLLLRAYGSAGGFQFVGNASAITLTAASPAPHRSKRSRRSARLAKYDAGACAPTARATS